MTRAVIVRTYACASTSACSLGFEKINKIKSKTERT